MTLPHELTTFPQAALQILRYLSQQQDNAAYDSEMIDALGLSERGFGKAIRRLVTKEYVEMQIDGTYALTRRGVRGAEALTDYDIEGGPDDDGSDDLVSEHAFRRGLILAYPRTLPAGEPAYLFARIDGPPADDDPLKTRLDATLRLAGDFAIDPDQVATTVEPGAASDAVRFVVIVPHAGHATLKVEVFQVDDIDLINAGQYEVTLTAVKDGASASTFRVHHFDMILVRK